MSNRKVHLRINHEPGNEPTFFVTACGIKHLHSGQVLGSDNRQAESVQPGRFDDQILRKSACERCALQWRNNTWRLS